MAKYSNVGCVTSYFKDKIKVYFIRKRNIGKRQKFCMEKHDIIVGTRSQTFDFIFCNTMHSLIIIGIIHELYIKFKIERRSWISLS